MDLVLAEGNHDIGTGTGIDVMGPCFRENQNISGVRMHSLHLNLLQIFRTQVVRSIVRTKRVRLEHGKVVLRSHQQPDLFAHKLHSLRFFKTVAVKRRRHLVTCQVAQKKIRSHKLLDVEIGVVESQIVGKV